MPGNLKPSVDYYVSESTGRRRKLTDGQMVDITSLFKDGIPVGEICELYNVSANVVYSICYWTPRGKIQKRGANK